MRHNCGRRGGHKAWPLIAMMAANSGRGWGGFGPDGPFGPAGPFGPSGPFGPGGPFGSGGRRSGGGGGGRRRGRMFASGELRLVLLKLIADEPRHGYELIKAIEEMTGGAYAPSPGTIYPTLALLEDEGAIAPAPAPGDEARKAYAATDAGKAELDERADEVEALLERLNGHGEQAEGMASSDLFRAAGNLAAVVRNRVREGNFDEHARRKVVDLIDELAKKIERL
jgi:DNA-binding PadR family transcriptional regulator